MANELDETTGPVREEGRDVHVIDKQLPVKVGWGSTLFEILLWVCGILPGLVFLFMKISARNYLQRLQQKLQQDASQIDNYLEQRAYRGGRAPEGTPTGDALRNQVAGQVDAICGRLFPQVEAYPELKAHEAIADAMQQNSYLQKEITAARTLYNDTVAQWNADIFRWPTKMIVAARAGYTTRIPFTASAETRERARGTFF